MYKSNCPENLVITYTQLAYTISNFVRMEATAFVYILTTQCNTTLYCGIKVDLRCRIWEHKTSQHPGSFTSRYKVYKLVYYEAWETIVEAIEREKEIKGKSRRYKEDLINSMNPEWIELMVGPETKYHPIYSGSFTKRKR